MMNRIFLLLQLLIFTSALQAQTYTVYSTIGTTRIVEGKKSVPLTPRKQINTKMRLYIGAESAVTVLDEKNNKMYSFSTEGTFLVGQLVSKASNKGRSISKQYMSYLVKQLFSEGSQKMTHPDT
jgi:predicted RecA/RadA family phage recombinase